MPKIKTKRIAYKKFRISARGKISRAQACTSHNTAKKSRKRMRRLRHSTLIDKTNDRAVRRILPYNSISSH